MGSLECTAKGVVRRELCEMAKGVAESIEEVILRWFSHVERMENDRIVERVYV